MKTGTIATAYASRTRATTSPTDSVPSPARPDRARPAHAAMVAAVLLVGGIFWAGERRVPAGGAEGATLNGAIAAASRTPGSFRVGSFNIHSGKGVDRQRDIARTADCLRDMDLVALNEVIGSTPWRDWNQSQQLGEALACQWLFAPTESRWWHGSFGNGLLTRLPAYYWQRIPFNLAGSHTHRNLVLTAVDVDGARVNVVLTHLDSRDLDRRQNQLRAAGELFLSLAEPAILMGDLNSRANDEQLRRILDAPGVIDALSTGGASSDPGRIDWILTRGLKVVTSGATDTGASDHPFVWAELEVAR